MSNTRTENAVRNISVSIGGQVLNIVLNFVCRTIFIHVLGETYLGVSGLFSNILTVLSLAELGIGDAIVYKMYKPVADNDTDRIKSFMSFYKHAYWIIGLIVFIIGCFLLPFLPLLIKGGDNIEHISLIYFLYIVNSSSSYFFAHKKLIIITDQKGYIDTINRYIFLTVQNVLQIIVLLLFGDFIIYLSIQIVMNLFANINIAKKANRLYPFIKEPASKLPNNERRDIFKQTSALVLHKVGGVVVSGTDNILISSMIGIVYVGLYSNYLSILSIPQALLAYFFSPLTASIGNLINTSEKEHINTTFDNLFFINFWLYGLFSICLFVLCNIFIGKVWLDESYLLELTIVFFIVLNFYLTGMRQIVSSFKSASGLFWNDRFKPLIEALVNLVSSIILLKRFGLVGVIIGTTISSLTTTFWIEALVVYRNVLKKKASSFFLKYLQYFISTIAVGFVTWNLSLLVPVKGFFSFILCGALCLLVSNFGFWVLFHKSKEYKAVIFLYVRALFKKLRLFAVLCG